VLILAINSPIHAQVRINIKGKSPEPVVSNAFCEGYLEDMPFIFSFGGTSLRNEPAINFRYNALTGEIKELTPFPDGQFLTGAKASLVGYIVFVLVGQKENQINGTVYRYDQRRHVFLSEGESIPYPTTQHGQAKYRDSLIFVVGGSNTNGPVNQVQVYNPLYDSWQTAAPLPEIVLDASDAFFAAVISQDTLHVLAHLSSDSGATCRLFKSALNPKNLNNLEWKQYLLEDSLQLIPPIAGTEVRKQVHWIASKIASAKDSTHTIAFTLSSEGHINEWLTLQKIPGRVSSIARVSDTIQFLTGGVYPNAGMSDDIYMLTWTDLGKGTMQKLHSSRRFYLYPNPCSDYLRFQSVRNNLEARGIEVFNMQGRKLLNRKITSQNERISFQSFRDRAFIVRIFDNEGNYYVDKILKQ
jgi:hypothetical protein